jgi:hypothetical protein
VEKLVSETDGYSAIEEIPQIYGNTKLQDASHSIVTLPLVLNLLLFTVVYKVITDAGGKKCL